MTDDALQRNSKHFIVPVGGFRFLFFVFFFSPLLSVSVRCEVHTRGELWISLVQGNAPPSR